MFINLKYIYGIKRSAKICKNKERNLLFPQTDNSKQTETQHQQNQIYRGQRSKVKETVAQHQIRVSGQGTGCLALFEAAAPDSETHGFRINS